MPKKAIGGPGGLSLRNTPAGEGGGGGSKELITKWRSDIGTDNYMFLKSEKIDPMYNQHITTALFKVK